MVLAAAAEPSSIVDIGPEELWRRLHQAAAPTLLDVREPWEHALARLPGSLNVPLGELGRRLPELDPEAELIVYCHHGVRSVRAALLLARYGYRRLANLRGGLEAYSRVDPSIPRYG
jgi:rhodanese-related sulfurtransferase